MHLLIFQNSIIPVFTYGGTQRDIWAQGKEMIKLGHKVTYLVKKGSSCSFAKILEYNPKNSIDSQIPEDVDLVHFHAPLSEKITKKPYMITIHGNGQAGEVFDINSVFVSKNHAERHNSNMFVYNGLDFEELGKVDLNARRKHLLFLAKASRKEKNLEDCIWITHKLKRKLAIVGGRKISFSRYVKSYGMQGGARKNLIIQHADALLFPVKWHEPLGLAILESMYFGCPVFGSEYGSLPELISKERGFLSNNISELVEALKDMSQYNRRNCHEFVCDNFSAKKMTENYLKLYEQILNGKALNSENPKSLIIEKAKLLPLSK